MAWPIQVPELGAVGKTVTVGTWLVDEGQPVSDGDRLVEIQLPGLVFVVSSHQTGVLKCIVRQPGSVVAEGEILAWLDEPPPDAAP